MTLFPDNSDNELYSCSTPMLSNCLDSVDCQQIRLQFDAYLRMHVTQDDGEVLIPSPHQDGDDHLTDLEAPSIQALSDTIAVATALFTGYTRDTHNKPARTTDRLTLLFRKESTGWAITLSSMFPVNHVGQSEDYTLEAPLSTTRGLEEKVAELTQQLSEAHNNLQQTNETLECEIVKHKRTEAESRRAKATAEEANKAKSQFLAVMSHEIRTPLNALVGFSSLARTATDPVIIDQYHTILEHLSRSLMDLTNNILDMSKIEAGRMEVETVPFNLRQLIESLEEQYQPLAEQKEMVLQFGVADNIPSWLLGDPVRLRQILSNLLSNAIKFTLEGTITCTVSLPEYTTAASRQLIQFEVRDSGIGIPSSRHSQLFQPFHQLDPSVTRKFGGTGLGLTIVQNLTTMMGGYISFNSLEGIGSCFVVTLPLQETDTASDDLVAPVAMASGSVLVVEDNAFNRRLLEDILTAHGQQVTLAEDGWQALQLIEQMRFGIILLDIRMPDIDGIEVARRIRNREHQLSELPVPIIAITADADVATRDACLAAGINAVLTKPVIPDQLARVIAAHCGVNLAASVGEQLLLNLQSGSNFDDNPERVRQYRELLQQDIDEELGCLQAAFESDDRNNIGQAAHSLKGLCGQLKGKEPAQLAAWLQQSALTAEPAEIQVAIVQLHTLCQFSMAREESP